MVAPAVAPSASPADPILIHLSGGRAGYAAYVFSHTDAFRCRRSLRILGDFVGTLPKHTAQNQYLSLPLALSYEEASFGLARGYFRAVSAHPRDFAAPQQTAVARFWQDRKSEHERQAEEAIRNKEEERERRANKGLKRPREDPDPTHAPAATPLPDPDVDHPPRKAARISVIRRAARSIRAALHVFVPLIGPPPPLPELPPPPQTLRHSDDDNGDDMVRRTALEARQKQQARSSTLVVTSTVARPDEIRDGQPCSLVLPKPPGVAPERLADRGAVFADLHHKGYYLSCGAKFGADFLAYAGDPQLFHAALAVVVVAAADDISPLDVVALGRLGDSTKKRTVLAFRDEGEVQYIGVQWEETLP